MYKVICSKGGKNLNIEMENFDNVQQVAAAMRKDGWHVRVLNMEKP